MRPDLILENFSFQTEQFSSSRYFSSITTKAEELLPNKGTCEEVLSELHNDNLMLENTNTVLYDSFELWERLTTKAAAMIGLYGVSNNVPIVLGDLP